MRWCGWPPPAPGRCPPGCVNDALRQRRRLQFAADAATIAAMSARPSVFASTTMRRRPFSRRIWLGPSVSFTSAICRAGTQPDGVSIRRSPSPSVVRSLSGRRITTSKRVIAVDHARDHAAVRQPRQLLDHRAGLHAIERGAAVVDADLELRNAHLLFDLQVGKAGDLRKPQPQLLCAVAQRIEIVAEQSSGRSRRARPRACDRAGARSAARH